MTRIPLLPRRRVLRLAASLPVAGGVALAGGVAARPAWAATSSLAPFPNGATVLVAGQDGGALERWAGLIAPALEHVLPPGSRVRTDRTGGLDGVTGANQFDARAAPDGQTLLLVPGAAALAWLAGDPRAQFDVAHWVPVLAGTTPGVLAGRVALSALGPGHAVRIAAAGPAGPDLAALLALDLLGAEPAPVFGLTDWPATLSAFRQHAVDVVFLHGPGVDRRLAALADAGGQPLFVLGSVGEDGAGARDTLFPDLPSLAELYAQHHGRAPEGPRYAAWQAAAAAAQLDFAMVLPQLTPAALVALWRRACAQAVMAPAVATAAADDGVQPQASLAASASTAALSAEAPALLEVRRWLTSAFNWRPT